MSLEEVDDVVSRWKEKPPVGELLRAYFGIRRDVAAEPVSTEPKQVTQKQLDRIVAGLHATAAKGQRNPFS